MRIAIEVDGGSPTQTRALDVGALLNAGWAGRDSAAVAAHVAELRAIGVAPPRATLATMARRSAGSSVPKLSCT